MTAASRLGAKTGFIGAVGDNQDGKFLKSEFYKENIDISFLESKASPTPVNFIFVVKTSGEKFIIQSPYMYITRPSKEIIDENIFEKNNIGLIPSTAIYYDLTLEIFKKAKISQIPTSLDLEKTSYRKIWKKKRILELLKYVDILLPNKEGAKEITGKVKPIKWAKYFLDLDIKKIIITLGKDGCMAVSESDKLRLPGYMIDPVDTTGTGDTFCAAFDYFNIIKGYNLEKACLYANTSAARKSLFLGARKGMPNYSQVKSFLDDH